MPDNMIKDTNQFAQLGQTLAVMGQKVAQWTEDAQLVRTAVPGLYLFRRDSSSPPETVMYEPSVCLLTQGAKRVFPGEGSFVYDPHHFLIASIDIPTIVEVFNASPEKPCLGIVIDIDRQVVSDLLLSGELPPPNSVRLDLGISAGKVTPQILDAVFRLLSLVESPQDIPILAPVIQRELTYRLLVSEQGERLRQIATAGSRSNQISKAIDWLKQNFTQPLKVGELAARVGMSPSTFHQHFRALTARSPLQYQKWLRLNEARRLMLIDRLDISNAAFEVGYESPSQFSREYGRMFGASPRRDISQFQQTA